MNKYVWICKNMKKYKNKINDILLGKKIIDKQNDIIILLKKTINDLNEEIEMRKNLEIQLEDELNKWSSWDEDAVGYLGAKTSNGGYV